MNDLLKTLIRQAKDAHKSAREYERGGVGSSYYRGLRRGYLSSARQLKLKLMRLEDWQKVCASY